MKVYIVQGRCNELTPLKEEWIFGVFMDKQKAEDKVIFLDDKFRGIKNIYSTEDCYKDYLIHEKAIEALREYDQECSEDVFFSGIEPYFITESEILDWEEK